jgi:hypothetical protein
MTALYLEGIAAGGDPPHVVAEDEPSSLEIGLRDLSPGDVLAMMCIETGPESRARLEAMGGVSRGVEKSRSREVEKKTARPQDGKSERTDSR